MHKSTQNKHPQEKPCSENNAPDVPRRQYVRRYTKKQLEELLYDRGYLSRHPWKRHKPSQKALAEALGIHHTTINRIFNGDAYTCRHDHVQMVALALGISPDKLPMCENGKRFFADVRRRIVDHFSDVPTQ